MSGLSRLQHLTLRENPIAKKDGKNWSFYLCFIVSFFILQTAYRITLFNRIRTLISLDGMDKHGKKDMNSQGLTGNLIEKFFFFF
jgi:hypothetical protein